MQIHQVTPKTKSKKGKYIGRGGKRGTYSGRGIKGQKARAGRKMRPEINSYGIWLSQILRRENSVSQDSRQRRNRQKVFSFRLFDFRVSQRKNRKSRRKR